MAFRFEFTVAYNAKSMVTILEMWLRYRGMGHKWSKKNTRGVKPLNVPPQQIIKKNVWYRVPDYFIDAIREETRENSEQPARLEIQVILVDQTGERYERTIKGIAATCIGQNLDTIATEYAPGQVCTLLP